jgi:hypothetical protein
MADKKNLLSLAGRLAPLADTLPTQRPPSGNQTEPATPPAKAALRRAAPAAAEPQVQISLTMRRSLRKQLELLCVEANMPMRAFILSALQAKGLDVTETDIEDRRKIRS